MSSNTLHTVEISNISNQTSEEELRNFFGFCGKISHLSVEDADVSTRSATIAFDSDTAVKTACLIDNTQLGGNFIHVKPVVTPEAVAQNISANRSDADNTAYGDSPNGYQFSQSEKPRTRILAEYLAYGYHISTRSSKRA
jgi:RNA recognition motif-containing protein